MESISETPGAALPELYAGALCLDFANTVDARALPQVEEHLFSYADLLGWARYAGLTDARTTARLDRLAADDPAAAAAVFDTAIELREAVFRTFAALAGGSSPAQRDLDVVQHGYAAAMAAARLSPQQPTGFGWEWDHDDLGRAWWPVAHSAVELLTTAPLDRVKVCASDEGCAGLFLDTSKNRSRRWCSMRACGVEVKVQRQTARRRAARTGTETG
jgi:predicted RNA-binding Zn ribbon-like protein